MKSSREAGGVRSSKRHALGAIADSPITTAARAGVELDDMIWTRIVEFLPVPDNLTTEDYADEGDVVVEVVATWQTLLDLRLVNQSLAALLHPRQQTLWRRLVLQSFDFSTSDEAFNAERLQQYPVLKRLGVRGDSDEEEGNGEEVEVDKETEASADEAEQDPHLLAMRGRYDTIPENYLEEDLLEWSKIGIYHRPSQYGFLTTLQQQPPQGSWPESENAFTLFGDIVRLLQLPHGDCMESGGDGGGDGNGTMFKYLSAPTEAGPSSPFYRFYVMKTLGYIPHCWRWGPGISNEWKGFSQPEAMEATIANHFDNRCEGGATDHDVEDDDDQFEFPICYVHDAKKLFHRVREHYRDWRSVCCNEGNEETTPAFFVGESKAVPHRWTGYVGLKLLVYYEE